MRTLLSKLFVILAYSIHPRRTVRDGLTHLEGMALSIEYFAENAQRLSALRERCEMSIPDVQAATQLPTGLLLFVEGNHSALVGMYQQTSVIANDFLVAEANRRAVDISDIVLVRSSG